MPIYHAVLALLTDGPSYGYELKANFEASIGPQWGRLNPGQIYQTLERLDRRGYVSSERVHQDTRPDRRVYALTEAGRTELTDWLAEPADRSVGYRDELFFKLLAAARQDGETLGAVISLQRHHQLGHLRRLAELRDSHRDDAFVTLLIDAAAMHTEADLRLLEQAESRIGDLVGQRTRPPARRGAEDGIAAAHEESA